MTVDDPGDKGVPASLRKALLTKADLPSGWSVSTLGDRSTEVCPGHDPATSVAPGSALKASFAAGAEGPYLANVVAAFDDSGEAKDYLDALDGALRACASFKDDAGSRYTVKRTASSNLGDESVNADVTVASSQAQVHGRILCVRVGDKVATVVFYAVGEGDASVAVDALEKVVGRL